MQIKPNDFLLAKSAVDYFVSVFGVELTEELYKFHIYNQAIQFSVNNAMSEKMQIMMAERDGFLESMESFGDRYWEMMQQN